MLKMLCGTSRQHKELMCKLGTMQQVVAMLGAYKVEEEDHDDNAIELLKESNEKVLARSVELAVKELLLEMCSNNPRYLDEVKNGVLTLLASTDMAKRISVQVLLSIVKTLAARTDVSMFVLPALALARSLDAIQQYEAVSLLGELVVPHPSSVCVSIAASLNSNPTSGAGISGVLMALKEVTLCKTRDSLIESSLVRSGIVEEVSW